MHQNLGNKIYFQGGRHQTRAPAPNWNSILSTDKPTTSLCYSIVLLWSLPAVFTIMYFPDARVFKRVLVF